MRPPRRGRGRGGGALSQHARSHLSHPFPDTSPSPQRFALGLHGLAILRELWCACTRPGTAGALARACGRFVAGKGWSLSLPAAPRPAKGRRRGAAGASPGVPSSSKLGGEGGDGGEGEVAADLDW